jgi:hypothetical protein
VAEVRILFSCYVHQLVSNTWPGNSPRSASIHILDNDSLLTIFWLYRPVINDHIEGQEGGHWYLEGGREWELERWWYKLAQVCQRWRSLILGSPSYLGLCLFCTNGTPVADMLAHSPPLPLVIDYHAPGSPKFRISTEEKDRIILALERRDRVCRIRFTSFISDLPDLIMSIDGEYPVLEYLIVGPPAGDMTTAMMLPGAFQAPRLRHLEISRFALPVGSQLFPTIVHLVTLTLIMGHPSTDFQPDILLQWLSFMPLLEKLSIIILIPNAESQVIRTPIVKHVTLPNLHWFNFQGDSAFEEALVRRMTTPRLERLRILFVEQPSFSVPNLLQYMNTTRHLSFDSVKVSFFPEILVRVNRREDPAGYVLLIGVKQSWTLDLQVSSMAQIFDSIGQIFSSVEYLAFEFDDFYEARNEFDRTEWRRLLRPFCNVKTLHIDDTEELVEGLSHILRVGDGEDPLEVLPELQELTYSGSGETGEAFAPLIDALQNAGRPVTLVRRPRSVTTHSRSSSQSSLESLSVISWDSKVAEAGSNVDT